MIVCPSTGDLSVIPEAATAAPTSVLGDQFMTDAAPAANRGGLIRNRDGLNLHVAHWPAPRSTTRPVLCLPGLTRNGRDFDRIAASLSSGDDARCVFALDARGRGRSDHAADWRTYSVPTEAQDVIDVMAALGLSDAAIIGTSRGGLLAMVVAAIQPGLVGAVVLNDIGPVIERAGLIRIAGYVGRMPLPLSWDDAIRMVADISRKAFPAVNEATWAVVARAWFNDKDGRPASGYDPALGKSFSSTDATPPALWPQFGALKHAATLVVRGETSDILSAATVVEMQARHPDCARFEVKGEGHAPLLMDDATIAVIRRFLVDADAGKSVAGRSY
jgi:pimeloyl-ACP methyl ester carboxylesterase